MCGRSAERLTSFAGVIHFDFFRLRRLWLGGQVEVGVGGPQVLATSSFQAVSQVQLFGR